MDDYGIENHPDLMDPGWQRRAEKAARVELRAKRRRARRGRRVWTVVALVAVLATMITGNLLYDAAGTIVIGVLLVVVAVAVASEVKDLLIGQGVEPKRREALVDFINARPEVDVVLNLITLQMGPDVMVAVKARMAPAPDQTTLIQGINSVERAMKTAFPDIRWSFFEPDITD